MSCIETKIRLKKNKRTQLERQTTEKAEKRRGKRRRRRKRRSVKC